MPLLARSVRKVKSILYNTYLDGKRKAYSQIEKTNKPITFTLPRGVKIDLYPQGQIAELLYLSKFEYPELEMVIGFLKPGMNVIDIGANVGLYSIVADKMIGKSGKIWAFEPSHETNKRLMANLSLNNVSIISVEKMALADVVDAELTLKRDPGYRDGDRYLSTRKKDNQTVDSVSTDVGDTETVKVTTLDHYIYEIKDVKSPIDFLKMDIEGGEFSVFKGANKVLENNPDILLMFECTTQGCECNGHKVDDVFEYLRTFGFQIYCWDAIKRTWDDSAEATRVAGNLWACRNKEKLPH
jgi:FkbM family methyltransferase